MNIKVEKWHIKSIVIVSILCALAVLAAETYRISLMRGMVINYKEGLCISIPPKAKVKIMEHSLEFIYPEGKSILIPSDDLLDKENIKFSLPDEDTKITLHAMNYPVKKVVHFLGPNLNLKAKLLKGEFKFPNILECRDNGYYDYFLKNWSPKFEN